MAEDLQKRIIVSVQTDTSEAQQGVDEFKKKLGSVNDVDVTKSIKTLKQDLKEAQNEAQRMFKEFGSGSKEFQVATTRVGDLKNQIDEVNLAIQNFNPDNKLQALVSLGRAGVGALQGVSGAMAFLGVQSETAEKTIAKLQGLMAFSDALNSLGDLKDTFKNINTLISNSTILQKANNAVTVIASAVMKAFGVSVATTSAGFKALKVAIASTGIGLLVIGLSSLISKISDWIGGTDEAEAAQKRLNSALERQQELLDSELKGIDYVTKARLARAKIAGKTEAELATIEDVGAKERIQALKDNYERLEAIAKDSDGRKLEDQEKANKAFLDAHRDWLDALSAEDLRQLDKQADAAEKGRQQAKSNADKSAAQRKAAAEKLKAEREKELSELKSHQDEVDKINKESLQNLALRGKSEREADLIQIKLEYDTRLKTVKDTEAEELKVFKKYNSEKTLGKEVYHSKLNEIQKKYQDVSNNLLTDYLGQQFEIEEKYQKVITDFIAESMNAVANEYVQKRVEINKQIDELLKNATDSQKAALEQLRTEQLNQADKEQNLQTVSIKAETQLISTEVSSTIDETDSPDQRRAKIESLRAAELDAENAAFELKKEQLRNQKEELEKLEAEHNANIVNINKDASDAKKEIDEAELEAKRQATDAAVSLANQAADLLGKNTVAGKALAVAATTVDTFKSATSAYAGMVKAIPGPGGIAAGFAAATISVAAGLANVKKILSVKVPGKDGGGSGSVPSAPAISTAPVINAAETSAATAAIQDVRVVNQRDQTIKAYITDRDLKDNEKKSNFLNNLSSI